MLEVFHPISPEVFIMLPRVSQFPPPVGPRFVSGWARGMGVRKRWTLIDRMQ